MGKLPRRMKPRRCSLNPMKLLKPTMLLLSMSLLAQTPSAPSQGKQPSSVDPIYAAFLKREAARNAESLAQMQANRADRERKRGPEGPELFDQWRAHESAALKDNLAHHWGLAAGDEENPRKALQGYQDIGIQDGVQPAPKILSMVGDTTVPLEGAAYRRFSRDLRRPGVVDLDLSDYIGIGLKGMTSAKYAPKNLKAILVPDAYVLSENDEYVVVKLATGGKYLGLPERRAFVWSGDFVPLKDSNGVVQKGADGKVRLIYPSADQRYFSADTVFMPGLGQVPAPFEYDSRIDPQAPAYIPAHWHGIAIVFSKPLEPGEYAVIHTGLAPDVWDFTVQ